MLVTEFTEQQIMDFILLVIGGVSLPFIWEGIKFFWPDLKNYLEKRIEAKKIVYSNFDPIIKSADELYGKLLSLANEDFATFKSPEKAKNSLSSDPEHNKKYVLYLFAQFWATLENIRLQNNYSSISRIKKGRQLLKFIDTIESRNFRILDRSKQRIIGEGMIINSSNKFQVIPLYEFLEKINTDPVFASWINELERYISSLKSNKARQRILVFGIIVAALIDHFDPNHRIARQRQIYVQRIRPKTANNLKHILFKRYLEFVKSKERYYNIGRRRTVKPSQRRTVRGLALYLKSFISTWRFKYTN